MKIGGIHGEDDDIQQETEIDTDRYKSMLKMQRFAKKFGNMLRELALMSSNQMQYKMKVIVDLHAVEGSLNDNDHSGIRDGYEELGTSIIHTKNCQLKDHCMVMTTVEQEMDIKNGENRSFILKTVAVIDFLAKRNISGEWAIQNSAMQDNQGYARAELAVYGRATFGWGLIGLTNATSSETEMMKKKKQLIIVDLLLLFTWGWGEYCCWCLPSSSSLLIKGVNLGGWLVIEGWMTPSLFHLIPNKDLLVCSAHELFLFFSFSFCLWRINETSFNFRVSNKDFVGLSSRLGQGIKLLAAHSAEPGTSETFTIIRDTHNPFTVRIQASNNLYLQAATENSVTADYSGSLDDWGNHQDPSLFEMHIVKTIQGEYQITNGYGPDEAPDIMRKHWSTYIVEDDFRFMSQNGLNAVRIPVGWWIKYDPTPPKPFVGGSLEALDNAFAWALNYNMKVILDLHAVPGSQNGNHHSGTRDGFLEWGDSRILETVSVIDFLAQRYGGHPSLGAIQLMNEPLAPAVTLDSLRKYYKAGYDAVRTYTATTYVILSNRLGEANSTELFPLAAALNNSVIDVHYYNRYSDYFRSLNAQQNVDYIYKKRSKQLEELTRVGGPLSFIGEWTADLYVHNASMKDYQRFVKAQLDVYGKATFGWAYWSYKCEQKYWSFKWMIENEYMKL
ncbi:hypothetical protein BUALT_Bualt08G0025800 [Buddleja alternifolia]|uniref:Mannan endo-1,4-beta-mannosidase n=1 Tax=Buddleja alternifolia TaxID=168488 RepID=A0AAV6X4J2_9LAMI|nr:hypothetical protein BUALT_Bualt08G0025800 [Buddleja alternifolia]